MTGFFRSSPFVVFVFLALSAVPDWGSGQEPQLRTLNSHFPFRPAATVEEWQARREALTFHLQMSLGLWPLPERTPLNAVVHGRQDFGDYSLEKVFFESLPGFFVTGSLYRGRSTAGRVPAILCPHGHYTNGRFMENSPDQIRAMLERNEESLAESARSPLQARCVHLARMGCTVFHYDMIGYADSQQIPQAVAHDFARQRGNQDSAGGQAFFSPRAEMKLQSILGLQTWNSIRAIDFVQSLPEVDPLRIGVTGSSGGGTQSFVLAALDGRVAAAFPAVMVSTGMQGGCTCENCCNLRVGTGNVGIAALSAPRPMAFSAANDWTATFAEDGFPQLQQHYRLLGKPENTFLTDSPDFPHGFNQIARRVMYAWFDRHFAISGRSHDLLEVEQGPLPEESPLRERPFVFLSPAELTVWDEAHPAPPAGIEAEYSVTRIWNENRERQLAILLEQPEPAAGKKAVRSLLCEDSFADAEDRFRKTSGLPVELAGIPAAVAVQPCFGAGPPARGSGILVCESNQPEAESGRRELCLFVSAPVDQFLKNPPTIFRELLAAGRRVIVITGDESPRTNRLVENGREAAGYTYGYNRSQLAAAAGELLGRLETIANRDRPVDFVFLDDTAATGVLVAAAWRTGVGSICLGDGFRFADVDSLADARFFPGSLCLGDLPGFLAIADPVRVLVLGSAREGWDHPLPSAKNLRQRLVEGLDETSALKHLLEN